MNIIKNSNADFDCMISAAKTNLPQASDCEFNECVVVKTAGNNLLIHKIAADTVEGLIGEQCRIVSELEGLADTEAERIVCMWGSGELDVPSYGFMQRLCKINNRNMEAYIMLNSAESRRIVRIGDIIGRG